MSNKTKNPASFLEQYRKVIFDTINKNKVKYTNEQIAGNTGHHYFVNSKEVYVSTIKIVNPEQKTQEPKYMMNIEINVEGDKIAHKCSGEQAKHFHQEMFEKYDKAIKRTCLRARFQNPSFSPKTRN